MWWQGERLGVGLDVSDRAVEAVALRREGRETVITSLSRRPLPTDLVIGGVIKDRSALIKELKLTLAEAKPTPIKAGRVVIGLPETQFYTLRLTLPTETETNLNQVVRDRVLGSLPFLPSEVVFQTKVLSRGTGGSRLLVMAVPRLVIETWLGLGPELGLDVVGLEPEAVALARVLVGGTSVKPCAILDLGARLTFLTLVDERGVVGVTDILKGSESWTVAIASILNLKTATAESQKIADGLGAATKTRTILLTELTGIIERVKPALEEYESERQQNIVEIYLTGGGSRLPSLADYLTQQLGRPVKLGSLPFGLIGHGHHRPLLFEDQHIFIEAAGLGLRALGLSVNQADPFIRVRA